MATDYGEKEREFLDGLKESTGRDLSEWMAAISEKDLPHRNDIIDWLRHQGFMFSQASWLERVHHNGGRPIYADSATANLMAGRLTRERAAEKPVADQSYAEAAGTEPPLPEQPPEPMPIPAVRPTAQPDAKAAAPAAVPPASDDLAPVLAKAKAYRMLAQHVITQVKSVRPDARFSARSNHIVMADPEEFAVLAVTGKELRLHIALGDEDGGDVVKKGSSPPGLGPPGLGKSDRLTHMIVLTDARQIDRRLLDIVARAAARVNGG